MRSFLAFALTMLWLSLRWTISFTAFFSGMTIRLMVVAPLLFLWSPGSVRIFKTPVRAVTVFLVDVAP